MRPNGSPEKLKARRKDAARLLRQGKSQAEVARTVGVSRSSVHRWSQALAESGMKGLNGKRHAGPRPKLSESQRKELKELVSTGVLASSHPYYRGFTREIAREIQRRYGVTYQAHSIGRLLRSIGLDSDGQIPRRLVFPP